MNAERVSINRLATRGASAAVAGRSVAFIEALYVQASDSAEESEVEQALTAPAVADPTAR
jgi:hypothetical protein